MSEVLKEADKKLFGWEMSQPSIIYSWFTDNRQYDKGNFLKVKKLRLWQMKNNVSKEFYCDEEMLMEYFKFFCPSFEKLPEWVSFRQWIIHLYEI